jgi:2-polyprenyl-3-methyl-5-hydroxy-6-metoxy-1,4-benzoquinol methylase
MKECRDNLIPRIRLRLNDLKSSLDLIEVYEIYRTYVNKFFPNGRPEPQFFDQIRCPICSAQEAVELLRLDNIEYSTCQKCKAVYTPLMLKNELLKEMYESGVYQQYFSKLTLKGQTIRKEVLEKRKFNQINSLFSKPGRLLDVGCGSGSFLNICRQNGWSVIGVDPSEGAVNTARVNYKVEVEQVFFEDYELKDKFDCIVFFGLEHLQDPRLSLQKAVTALNTNGVVFIEVPSSECFLMKYLEKFPFPATRYIEAARHYLFFSRTTLKYLAREFKLDIEMIETNGLDLDTILLDHPLETISEEILNMQETLNSLLLGDHFRVAFRKT